ncbi:carbohydrate-binding family 9-like protein [Natronorubrum sp. FCH18a]|uniref:carbohydrate-binding family 9-like protein n=1 Tax=Natronorubrum sp. FCH18a TaxID=3447018 RepID=UPI003F518B7F
MGSRDAVPYRQILLHDGEPTPRTTGRALDDDQAIDLQFHVEDRDITPDVTERNGSTYRDSSIEFFAVPDPDDDSEYFNFKPTC